jgi:hypothetical protein
MDDWIASLHRDAEGRLPEEGAANNGRPGSDTGEDTPKSEAATPAEEETAHHWDPPVGAFPEIAWRGTFATYRETMKDTTAASDVGHFVTFWGAAAAALARRVWMYQGDHVYPNAYLCYFGPTGDYKTTGQRRLPNCGLLAERADVPILQATGSAEGLADAFAAAAKTGVIIFLWEELAETLIRSKWSGSTLIGFLIETFDCPPVYDRAYRKNTVHIDRPTPNILTATTPELFWQYMQPVDFYSGFANRSLYLTGKKKPPLPIPSAPDQQGLVSIRKALGRLKDVPKGEVKFTPQAQQRWIEFFHEWENRALRPLAMAATQRIRPYVCKLAMTCSALEGTLPYVDDDQLAAAIEVGRYSARCVEYLIDLQTAPSTADGDLTEYLVKYVRDHEGIKYRTLQQNTSRKVGSAERLNRAMDNLCRAERIEIRKEQGGPKRVYYIR